LSRFSALFPGRKPMIGMIHLPPLPDYDKSPGIDAIIESALADLRVLQEYGIDGVLIENEYDRPHRVSADPATIQAMTQVTAAVVAGSRDIVVGCEILLNDPQASLAVAKAAGASFIRTDYFVDRMSRPEYGEFAIDPEGLLAYRESIGAPGVLILADIHVKYATLLEERTLAESAALASAHHANAVIISGTATGSAPTSDELRAAGSGSGVPVIIGSGLDPANAACLLQHCDGAIVGTALMCDRRVNAEKVSSLMDQVRRVRAV
jgi:hypothetical protein